MRPNHRKNQMTREVILNELLDYAQTDQACYRDNQE